MKHICIQVFSCHFFDVLFCLIRMRCSSAWRCKKTQCCNSSRNCWGATWLKISWKGKMWDKLWYPFDSVIFDPADLRLQFMWKQCRPHISTWYVLFAGRAQTQIEWTEQITEWIWGIVFYYLYCSALSGCTHAFMSYDLWHSSGLSQQQQVGRRDRLMQQQKLDEAQYKAHEVSLGRVCILTICWPMLT